MKGTNKKLEKMLFESVRKSLSENKKFILSLEEKKLIRKAVTEALEDELEQYIEIEDEDDYDDFGGENFEDDVEGLDMSDYELDLDQLSDNDVIEISKENGTVVVKKIEKENGEELYPEDMIDSGIATEANTHGVTIDPTKKNKIKKVADELNDPKSLENVNDPRAKVASSGKLGSTKITKENVVIKSEDDFIFDSEDEEVVVDDDMNVTYVPSTEEDGDFNFDNNEYSEVENLEDENLEDENPEDENPEYEDLI